MILFAIVKGLLVHDNRSYKTGNLSVLYSHNTTSPYAVPVARINESKRKRVRKKSFKNPKFLRRSLNVNSQFLYSLD
jgi:hypothetical protein